MKRQGTFIARRFSKLDKSSEKKRQSSPDVKFIDDQYLSVKDKDED